MNDTSHILILRAFDELPFSIGKKTFVEFLKGNPNPTIEKNNLEDLNSYGILFKLDINDILDIVHSLAENGYITYSTIQGGFQVLKRTPKGAKEIYEKKFEFRKEEKTYSLNSVLKEDIVTEEDKKIFEKFDFFLDKYNEEQKKAIISNKNHILCIAGAGSGKTTVLTKRCEFLTKFRGVKERKILAITFTRKARNEMKERLEKLGIKQVFVETFNSFSEKLLRKHGSLIYDREFRVATFSDKIKIVSEILRENNIHFDEIQEKYFTKRQKQEKRREDLFFIFVNDIFSIIDFYKNSKTSIEPFYEREKNVINKRIAKMCYVIASKTEKRLVKRGLRDFSDQILDGLKLLQKNPNLPTFEHVLVDEFQDINHAQMELIKALEPQNVFAVGDPRQAIYGWRGSEIRFILDFPKIYENTQVIMLKKNYRSDKNIVKMFNECIKPLNLPNLESSKESQENNIFLIQQDSERTEKLFITEAIKNSLTKRKEIFVLARTNKLLQKLADEFDKSKIKYAIKSEEEYLNSEATDEEVTLATVHSIKGMEADEVYIVGANSLSFPNKVQDNFVFALLKQETDYDKQAEELRLFYVALSRAKKKVIITYTGKYSPFITNKMLKMVDHKIKNKNIFAFKPSNLDPTNSLALRNILKDWRTQKSDETGLPTYMIVNNTAIDEICRFKPQSKKELLNIKGLGDLKIAKYGDEILKLING